MMRIRVFDTETTGLGTSALACEAGYHDLVGEGTSWAIERIDSAVFNTNAKGVRVDPEARKCHGIQDDEIDRGWDYSLLDRFIGYLEPDVYAAHNAQFDLKFFKTIQDRSVICTMKVAKRVWKNAPSFKNGELGIWKGIIQDLSELHRVRKDTYVTAHLLKLMLEEGHSVDTMVAVSGFKVDPEKLSFGKHAGKRVDNPTIPLDYLEFLLTIPNLTESQRKAVDTEVARRHGM